jgi:hypothetical protein
MHQGNRRIHRNGKADFTIGHDDPRIVWTVGGLLEPIKKSSGSLGSINQTPVSSVTIKMTLGTVETTGTWIGKDINSVGSMEGTLDAFARTKTVFGTLETTAAMTETMKRMTGTFVINDRKNCRNGPKIFRTD